MSRLKGEKELLKILKQIPADLDRDVDTVLEVNAQSIVRDSKKNIQENGSVRTGKMLQSQGVSDGISSKGRTKIIQSNATGLALYDVFVEYGTRFQRAKPFFFPAVFKGRQKYIEDLKDLLNSTFKKV